MTENSFLDIVLQFEETLSIKDIKELIGLANSAHEEELFGQKLYVKLMELEKDAQIYGENICDRLYGACI